MSGDSPPLHDQATTPEGLPPEEAARAQLLSADDHGGVPLDLLLKSFAPPQGPNELGRLGGYRVLGLIGAGGMGIVLRAEDALLQRPAALKLMRPLLARHKASRERFLREAQAIAAVDHPNVVRIYGVGDERGLTFFAMELLEGESLSQRLKRGPIPLPEVLHIGRAIALGLQALHARGLIHRDIKPANVFLGNRATADTGEGKPGLPVPPVFPVVEHCDVKILDFGLVRAPDSGQELTQVGVSVGTPAYMAPEQAESKPIGPSADIFSLGCVLYRLCTEQLPFPGNDTLTVLAAQARGLATPPRQLNRNLPLALNDLIVSMLAVDPAKRPTSAAAVAKSLEDLQKGRGMPPRAWRFVLWAAALLIAAFLGRSLWWLAHPPKDTNVDARQQAAVVNLTVPAREAWTHTGVSLTIGTEIHITASGLVDASPPDSNRPYFLQVPPEGREERVAQAPQPTMPGLCLLGKVGDNVFYVGKELRFTVSADRVGELQLGINDDLVDDNSGSWTVRIEVTKPKR